ncbi:rsaA [Symbiodinium microadriaticum]|nr:rsaA [Symbiodinium microadriaticum]
MAITAETRNDIIELVVAAYNAAPGTTLLNELVAIIDGGGTLADVAVELTTNAEWTSRYPTFQTAEEFAAEWLGNIVPEASAEAIAEGTAVVVGVINGGGSFADIITEGANFLSALDEADASFGTSAANFNNRVEVAAHHTVTLEQAALSSGALDGVTSTDSTVDTAKDSLSGTSNVGQTFTLTSSIDTITGGAGNDRIIAGTQAGNATLSAGDTLVGEGGTDTLVIANSGVAAGNNAAAFATANISGIEVIEYTSGAAAQPLNITTNSSVTAVNVVAGFGNEIDLTLSQAATLTGVVDNSGGAGVTLDYASSTGPADSATVILNGFNPNTTNLEDLDIPDVETLTFNVTSSSTIIGLDIDATTVNIMGSGFGTFSTVVQGDGASASLVTKVDGSGSSLGFFFDNDSAAAADETVTGGDGVVGDTYRTNFANLTKDDKYDLAGGGTDTISFSDAVDLSSVAAAAAFNAAVTNVEQIDVDGAGTLKINGDAVTQTLWSHDSTGAITLTNVASADTLNVQADAVAASTANMKLGQNTFNLGLNGTSTAVSDMSAGLTLVGASTVNIASDGSSSNANANKLALTTDDNGSIVISGDGGLILTTTQNTGTTGLSINGSASTGILDITGTPDADILIGGSAKDQLKGGDGADTMTGGAAADTFTVAITSAGVASTDFAAALDTITDFATGSDKLEFGAAAGSAANYAEAAAAVADFATAQTAAAAALNGTVLYSVQQVGSDVYVFYDADGTIDAAGTEVVKLTGVSLTGIAQADVV